MRVKFSRTIRRHMREPELYPNSTTWTEEDSDIVDALLKIVSSNTSIVEEDLLRQFHSEKPELASEERLEKLWKRMQAFPHCFEVASARKDVDSMDLHGKAIPSDSKALEQLQVVTDNGWNVPLDEVHDFATLGILCFSTWQMLANRFHPLLPEDVVMLTPHTLHGKNIAVPAKLLSTPKHKAVRPRLRFYP